MKKALVIIDMQNDFVTGSLANPDAEAIVNAIVVKINKFDGDIIATRDTHAENYLETAEGKRLPVPHCIENTVGWEIVPEIKAAMEKRSNCRILDKTSFGMIGPWSLGEYDSVEVVGTCTDICVVSNVLILKTAYPNLEIKVHANLCAGLTPEKHKAALSVMESCQVEII